jgi:hypothetical protein
MAQGSSKPTVTIDGQPVEVETTTEKELLVAILEKLTEILEFMELHND